MSFTDTCDKLAAFGAAAMGLATCTAGGGVMVIGGVTVALTIPAIINQFKKSDKADIAKQISNIEKSVKKNAKKWAKASGKFTDKEIEIAFVAIGEALPKLDPNPKKLMDCGRNLEVLVSQILDAASEKLKGDFGTESKDPQVAKNRKILENVLLALFGELEATEDFERAVKPFFEREVLKKLEQLLEMFDELKRSTKVERDVIIQMAKRVSEKVEDIEDARQVLDELVTRRDEYKEALAAPSNLDAEIDDILKAMLDRSGEEARDYINQQMAERDARIKREREAAKEKEALEDAGSIKLLQAAYQADIEILDLDSAATRIIEIAKIEVPDPANRFNHLRSVFMEYYERGCDQALLLDLQISTSLAKMHREDSLSKENGAILNNDYAISLFELGERAGGEAELNFLNDAVEAYDLALEVYQRDSMPVGWAMTQMNKAIALTSLGERAGGEVGLKYLSDAVKGHDLALEIYEEPGMEHHLEVTQHNRQVALDAIERLKKSG